ncbi:MAG TPA: hypothetical protein VGR16_01560 [Thermomicrobiales bacterium]|nr:hypothetical protein [Thermomicrobiales bacterium]
MARDTAKGTDSFYLDGEDINAVRQAMHLKMEEVRAAGGKVMNEQFETKRAGRGRVAEARFDYEMPVDKLGDEVEFNPPDVEDPQGNTTIEELRG